MCTRIERKGENAMETVPNAELSPVEKTIHAADSDIAAVDERASLIDALDDLRTNAQAFNSRGQTAAIVKALTAFDSLADRCALRTVDPELLTRLLSVVEFARSWKFIAVSIDLPDAERLLETVGGPS